MSNRKAGQMGRCYAPNKTSEVIAERIRALRAEGMLSKQIEHICRVSRSTVHKILKRAPIDTSQLDLFRDT